MERLSEKPATEGSCYLPLHASTVAHLYLSDGSLACTVHDLFSSFAELILSRYNLCERRGMNGQAYRKFVTWACACECLFERRPLPSTRAKRRINYATQACVSSRASLLSPTRQSLLKSARVAAQLPVGTLSQLLVLSDGVLLCRLLAEVHLHNNLHDTSLSVPKPVHLLFHSSEFALDLTASRPAN